MPAGGRPVGLDQLAEQRPLLLVVETVGSWGIFTHHEVSVNDSLFPEFRRIS